MPSLIYSLKLAFYTSRLMNFEFWWFYLWHSTKHFWQFVIIRGILLQISANNLRPIIISEFVIFFRVIISSIINFFHIGSCQLSIISDYWLIFHTQLVFKGPVYRTRNKTETGPNRITGCGCVHFRLTDHGCGTGCNQFCPQPVVYKVGLKNTFQMSLKS